MMAENIMTSDTPQNIIEGITIMEGSIPNT
jgi:hypothetical protein